MEITKNRIISRIDEFKLWGLSAGRCQICNIPIYEDPKLALSGNFAQKAHIRAVSKGGPRFDADLDNKQINSFENVMLLCAAHHKLIDDYTEYYKNEKLINIKKRHEDRVRRVTESSFLRTARIVTYFYKIDNNDITHNRELFKRALHDLEYVPEQSVPVDLSVEQYAEEREKCLYEKEVKRLTIAFRRKVDDISYEHEIIAVFALAPIPLLIKLGILINDQFNVKVFQCHRTGDKWSWRLTGNSPDYTISLPEEISKNNKKVAINLSISANIQNERIRKVVGNETPIYKMSTYPEVSRHIVKTEGILDNWVENFRKLIERIKNDTPVEEIKVFPAIPNSIAVRMGMDIMAKTDPKFIIYDEDKASGGFIETITINGDD